MAKQKYLVVSFEKNNRGCYEIYGWSFKNARGLYYLKQTPIRFITIEKYLEDFNEWDMPLSLEHVDSVIKDTKMKVEL